MDNRRIVRDGHVHTPFCPHGTKDPFESYIQKALELGIKEITFTEHMPLPGIFMDPELLKSSALQEKDVDEYIRELDRLKFDYNREIKINIGFEVDYIDGYEEQLKEMLNRYGSKIDDSILSVHFVKVEDQYYCVDESLEGFGRLVERLGSLERVYDKYFETLIKAVKADLGAYKPIRIGHPTLVRIFNLKYPHEYKNMALFEELALEIKKRNYEIDFNTAGLRKPYCKEAYPSGGFIELIKKYGVQMVYGSDAHTAADVGRFFEELK